ncbi:mediator of RNA polymerase II transcription subunit 16 isoform X2 [Syngnathus acus]|nr:mediator of RNA polymerase II transcription subunit 16 isoform X2 [Syngnathus acus]XP_037105221.1 mediator of RNA polymerase II transcription subunit 16 isoform X2 [Syngnathus acus]XP_037105222.1 mediator of RNA polymerase II transcription subunit 16 isoform X2 [Syngnathus acus]
MELAYVCDWERCPKNTHCPSNPLVCSWSCRNLVAFTTDLKDDGDSGEPDVSQMIHIMDTEHPWDVYSISSGHAEVISCLEWDQSGSRLLSADSDGHIKCWSMSEHLVNSWHSVLSSSVEGDPIVALSWLHNGVKLALHVEMSGSTNFGEKFSRVKFSPSLTLFGGKPMEGWLAVTVSGLVTVSLLKPGGALLTASECLCRLRGRVALADIAFTGGGNIVVAATDGSSSSPVQFYKVVVSVVSEKCRIDTELLPSLFLRCMTDPLRRDKYPAVTHLKFLTRENSEQVLLCASNQSGSIVECWSLRKEGLPVNNIFQHRSPVVGEKQPTILKWRILTTTNDLERVSAVALPKLPVSISNTDLKVASDTKFCPGLGLALAFHDGTIQILHRLSLHTMGVFYGVVAGCGGPGQRPGDESAVKRQRTGAPGLHFKALQFSWTSLALAGVDNHGKLHMLRVSPSMGQVLEMNTTLRHLLFLLEYCMVTGYDWWDVLLHVQPGMVHNLVDKLHEEYMRQNQALQQVLATRIVAVKASLCKLSTATAARACDFHAKLLLIAISSTLKSLLRPHVLNTPDKSPGERLSEICAKNLDSDIDKVMINLKTEEFVLDGAPLQSLQQLIQWVGDFVLYLLANLPNQVSRGGGECLGVQPNLFPVQGSLVRPGFGFMRDGASLGMLREMLVMIRIWGLLKPGCLPTFTATSDSQDSLQLLFRLLTKLWLCCRDDAPPQEPDESLIDECCLLPSQLLVPGMDWLPVNDGVTVRLQGKQPVRLHFGKAALLAPSDALGRSAGCQRTDNLRCVHMGLCPTEESKACTRCGCVTMLRSPNNSNAMKQWEQRWIKNCLCGGLWRRVPPTLA